MNLLTEEEAEKKWCPFAQGGINRQREKDGTVNVGCSASECMAWRSVGDPGAPDEPIFGGVNKGRSADLRGYCGLAGRPE